MTIDIWQSLFIGALQGATEFLPVSSDGHLVVIPRSSAGRIRA